MAQIQILEGFDLKEPRTKLAVGLVAGAAIGGLIWWWRTRGRDRRRISEIYDLTREPRDDRFARRRRVAQEELEGFGELSEEAEEALRQAFTAADDGDCGRVKRSLDRAQRAGADVTTHRRQLMADCRLGR